MGNEDMVPQGVDMPSWADNVTSYGDLMSDEVFLGEVPLPTILECLDEQFSSYIQLEDKSDYVDIFYDQLDASYAELEKDDYEFHRDELKEVLDGMYDEFIQHIGRLFDRRFTIHIPSIDDGGNREELEDIIRQLYTFFVLNCRENVKIAIAKDALQILSGADAGVQSEEEQFNRVNELMKTNYSPLLHKIAPTDFLTYTNAEDIREMYDTGLVTGNFLRKLSPRFFQYPDFEAEVVSYILDLKLLTQEIVNPSASAAVEG